jgi:Asp-tRNA(Asn)/Glu-tRNA(Gln) amidotransferase A subunit family amidase
LADPYRAFLAVPDEAPAGIPLAVKDLIDTAGLVTTYGSAIFRDHVPERSAGTVVALEEAGYGVVGKTNLHEFAYGITSDNPHFGAVVNPLGPARIPGGSSGGNGAALAAGLCEVALGTDSAGSIRLPAACCGVVGFKPTWGLVPADGVFPLAPSFDTVGPMARSVAACAQAMGALVGLAGVPVGELRAALAWTEDADPLVRARVEEAAALLPGVERAEFPLPGDVNPAFQAEAADVHRELFAEHPDLYGENVRRKLEAAFSVSEEDVEASRAEREAYRDRAAAALDGYDVLLTPTMPMVAPPVGIGDLALRERMISLTRPFNATGWPALALPCGPAEDGLPASIQIAARPGADALVLAVGEHLERALAK